MAAKSIDSLVEDIYTLFEEDQSFTTGDAVELATRIAKAIVHRFEPRRGPQKPEKIRPSNLGQPARKLWFDLQTKPEEFKFTPPQLLNFLYGDISEELMLWLAEKAGHTVTDQQRWVHYAGLRGKIDAKIDGHTTDAKSAFAKNFDKFGKGTLLDPYGDPYGYLGQISYYDQGIKTEEGIPLDKGLDPYFFAFNKVGSLCTMKVPPEKQIPIIALVDKLNKQMEADTPPDEYCYPAVPDGKSGNEKLGVQCQRCNYKWKCYPDMKLFDFSPPRYLTKIMVQPKKNKDITHIEKATAKFLPYKGPDDD